MTIEQNILKWYQFKENATVLEIFNEKSILEDCNKNIQLKTTDIKNLKLEGKYDYITLIGTFEYAPEIIDNEKSYSSFLKILREHLNKDGIIILAIDNRLGVKYLVGGKNKNYSKIFEGMEKKVQKGKTNLLLKKELIKFIEEASFENFKFYYPLPDYKFTSAIYTDNFLPKSNHSKIVYPVNYENGSIVIYNEINILKQICDIGQFDNFANSYLVEISDSPITNDIKFVNYNVFRKDKYKLLLTMHNSYVQKEAENDEAISHIKNIEVNTDKLRNMGFNVLEKIENNKIISEFIEEKEFDKNLIEIIEKQGVQAFIEEIKKWYYYIREKLITQKQVDGEKDIFVEYNIEIPEEKKKKLEFIKEGYIDLSFENVFCKQGYLLYDQEWNIKNIPLQFILYRAINNLYTYNNIKLENKIPKELIIQEFDLKQYEEYFEKLEEKIQEEILNKDFVEKYQLEERKYYKELEKLEKKIKSLEEEHENLEKKLENKENEINNIQMIKEKEIAEEKNKYENLNNIKEQLEKKYNELLNEYNTSRGWKVIKTVRKIIKNK